MKYGLQHNGKGKYHLIPEIGEGAELCGTSGTLLFTFSDELEVVDGKLQLIDVLNHDARRDVDEWEIREYCKKCIKKALLISKPTTNGK